MGGRDASAPGSGLHLLVVDVDGVERRRMARTLEIQGFVVTSVSSVELGQDLLDRGPVDLVVLDPAHATGFDALARLVRDMGLPVVVVSARTDEEDRVLALKLGADDYLPKPFSTLELAARIVAVLRRYRPRAPDADVLTYGDLEIDRVAHRVTNRGETVVLPPKEYDLLVALASRPGRTCSRTELLEWVWDSSPQFQDPATVIEHVGRLRRKLEEDASSPRHLVTVRRRGYRRNP